MKVYLLVCTPIYDSGDFLSAHLTREGAEEAKRLEMISHPNSGAWAYGIMEVPLS